MADSHHAAATTWGEWLTYAMDSRTPKLTITGLSRLSDGQLQVSTISYWRKDNVGASVDSVLLVCQLLGEDPVEPLRLAGHHRTAAYINPDAARAFLESTQADEDGEELPIQMLRESSLPEADKPFFEGIIRRQLARIAEEERLLEAERRNIAEDTRQLLKERGYFSDGAAA